MEQRECLVEGEDADIDYVLARADTAHGPAVPQVLKTISVNLSLVMTVCICATSGGAVEAGDGACEVCGGGGCMEVEPKECDVRTQPSPAPPTNAKGRRIAKTYRVRQNSTISASSHDPKDAIVGQVAVTRTRVVSDNALNELLQHRLASRLVEREVTPHVLLCNDAWYDPDSGRAFLLLEEFDATLDQFMDTHRRWCTPRNVGAVLFQVLHALHVLGSELQMRHQDLTDHNVAVVYITEETTFRGQRLCDATHFRYVVGGQTYYIPNLGVLLKVADFGFSSVTHEGRRFSRGDLAHFNEHCKDFGRWGTTFASERGYDLQTLFSDQTTGTLEALAVNRPALHTLLASLTRAVMGRRGRMMPERCRPCADGVSDVCAAEAIALVFGGAEHVEAAIESEAEAHKAHKAQLKLSAVPRSPDTKAPVPDTKAPKRGATRPRGGRARGKKKRKDPTASAKRGRAPPVAPVQDNGPMLLSAVDFTVDPRIAMSTPGAVRIVDIGVALGDTTLAAQTLKASSASKAGAPKN
jgi:hypothetical protein